MKWPGRICCIVLFLALALLALDIVALPSFAGKKSLEEKLGKVKGDNLSGVVVTTRINQAPGSLPYEPLEGVDVKVDGTKHQMVTDSNGVFHFKVKPGTYTLVVQKAGVGMTTKQVTVGKNQINATLVTVVLNPGQNPAAAGQFGPGGISAPLAPGVCYVAFSMKQVAGAPAGASKAGGNPMATTQSYRQMIMLGADPFSIGGTNAPPGMTSTAIGNINMGQYHTQTSVHPNTLMMLNGDSPGTPGYKEMSSQPFWLCFNASGTRLYVSTVERLIQVFDTSNDNLLLTSIPAGGIITDLKLSQDGNYVLAAVLGASPTVLMIDPRANAPQRSVPLPLMRTGEAGQPRGVAVNRESTRMFVAMGTSTSGEVVAVDMYTGIPQNAIKVGPNPTGLELSPDGRFLYVVNSGSGDVSVIDAWSFAEMGRIRVGVNPQKVAVTPDGSKVFVTNKGSDSVTVINGLNQAPIATVNVGKGPVGVAVSSDGAKAYVACTGGGCVTVLDARTGGVLASTSPLINSVPWGVCVRP